MTLPPKPPAALDYIHRADLHRPRDRAVLRVAVAELRARGLTERDVGAALRLDPAAVRELLGADKGGPPRPCLKGHSFRLNTDAPAEFPRGQVFDTRFSARDREHEE